MESLDLKRQVLHRDDGVEALLPKVAGAGWHGKALSKDQYDEFGSKNGLNRSFIIRPS